MIISSFVLFVAVVRIRQLETLIGASVDRRIPSILSMRPKYSTCVWVRRDINMIHEFIAAHLSQGIVAYTFFVDDPTTDYIKGIEENYLNLGLSVKFNKKSDRQSDLWECLTENVFEPDTKYVLITEVDTILFPLHDKRQSLMYNNSNVTCTVYKEFDFVYSGDHDVRFPNSIVSTHRRRAIDFRRGPKLLNLGNTVSERIMFLKTFKRKESCVRSTVHGAAKYSNKTIITHTNDERPVDMKERYHVYM